MFELFWIVTGTLQAIPVPPPPPTVKTTPPLPPLPPMPTILPLFISVTPPGHDPSIVNAGVAVVDE
jgi:hypothetical protein